MTTVALVAEPRGTIDALRRAAQELGGLLDDSRQEIEALGRDFEALAQRTDAVLELAAKLVGSEGCGRALTVLPEVHELGTAARRFIHERLEGTSRILETVSGEAKLLGRLSQLTGGQRAIVRETEMLRVLTNIEVARLGEVGAGFKYLAHELDEFAQSVARSLGELTQHTQEREASIDETRSTLVRDLPRMRKAFAETETQLEGALAAADRTLRGLCETPQRFKGCVEEIANQIAGVVAAIQAQDITRQQIEHVRSALEMIAGQMEGVDGAADPEETRAQIRAGLTIQLEQLKHIRETVKGWTSQIRECLDGIARIAAEEIVGLGTVVLAQERELAAQLGHIEQMEQASLSSNQKVQASLGGVAELMRLVAEHLERSKVVRDRLRLLMFNSIVEASHLGSQADGILEISTSIKRISAAWSALTGQSEEAMQEILALVEKSRSTMETFSEAGSAGLRESQEQTRRGLETLHASAHAADGQGRAIQLATEELHAGIAEIGTGAERLEACFDRLGGTVDGLKRTERELEGSRGADAVEVERIFAASYTTETERAVLRAALGGTPMPVAQGAFSGNSVELF
jgi:methyl-accepting chemotaxis protein